MGASDLRVTVDSAKLRCVLDPAVALGHAFGPKLALGLARAFEIWLTRSFWQVLDASELLLMRGRSDAESLAPDPAALCEWIAMRESTDAGSWMMRWVGDCVAESQLHGTGDASIVDRYEWLTESLQRRHESMPLRDGWCAHLDPGIAVMDALSLSATLDGALVLTRLGPGSSTPLAVQVLLRLGVPSKQVATADAADLFAAERMLVRQLLAGAGLATMLQALGPFCVVHVLAVPDDREAMESDPWSGVQAWWYLV